MVWSAVDAQAQAASEAYRATEAELRRRTDEQLQALLDALLEGQATPGLAARAAAGLDLPEHGPYAVVVLRAERRDGGASVRRCGAPGSGSSGGCGPTARWRWWRWRPGRAWTEWRVRWTGGARGRAGSVLWSRASRELGRARRLAETGAAHLSAGRAPRSYALISGCRRRWW